MMLSVVRQNAFANPELYDDNHIDAESILSAEHDTNVLSTAYKHPPPQKKKTTSSQMTYLYQTVKHLH